MSAAARKRLGITRRIADTTLRDLLCMLDPRSCVALCMPGMTATTSLPSRSVPDPPIRENLP
jgi:hypothetical protein